MFLLVSRLQLESMAKFLVLILPLCLFTGNAVVEIIVATVSIFFLTNCVTHRNWDWTKQAWVKVAFLLWFYFLTRSFFADDILLSLKRGTPWIRFVVFACAIGYWLAKDKLFVSRFKISLGVAVAFMSADAIFQFISGFDFLGRPYWHIGDYIRLLSLNGKMYIGNQLSLLSLPAVLVYYEHRKKLGILFPMLVIIPIIAVFLSGERMAFIILITCFIGFALSQKELRFKAVFVVFTLLIIAAPLVYLNKAPFARQYSAIYELANPNSTYMRIYHIAFDLIASDPILGIGLKHYQQKCNDPSYSPAWLTGEMPKAYYCQTHPHNIYIEILTETGLVGFVLFLLMIGLWIKNFWNSREYLYKNTFALACMITLLAKYIPVFSSSSYFVAWPLTSTWLFLGIVLSIRKADTE